MKIDEHVLEDFTVHSLSVQLRTQEKCNGYFRSMSFSGT